MIPFKKFCGGIVVLHGDSEILELPEKVRCGGNEAILWVMADAPRIQHDLVDMFDFLVPVVLLYLDQLCTRQSRADVPRQ